MSEGARVQSIDSIKEFRVRLAKFGESCGLALGEADSDMGKTLNWLEGEQQTFWNGQIRKRQEAVAKAEEAYRQKKLYKDASGSTPSAVEELKILNLAKKNLAEAIEKLAATKSWVRKLQKEMLLYRGGVARFANDVSSGIPQAIAQLGGHIEQLEKYVDIGIDAAESAAAMAGSGVGAAASGASMTRTTDVAPTPLMDIDGKILRGLIPPTEELAAAKRGPLQLKSIFVPPEHQAFMQGFGTPDEFTADDHMVIAANTKSSARLMITQVASTGPGKLWYISPVEATVAKEYTMIGAADLLEGHADLRSLLGLPIGFIAVLDFSGVSVVYDGNDAEAWKPAPPPAGGESIGAIMGVYEGRARIGKSVKELLMHWAETKMNWDDSTTRAFESRHLTNLEMDARTAVGAMDHMAQVLQQIKRDCQ